MNRSALRTLLWLKSLAAAFIGGGATTVSSCLGVVVGNAVGFHVQPLDFKQLGSVFLSGGICSVVLYLKRSPVPGYRRAMDALQDVQTSGR